jgi:ABC-type branched-subunit amino acid transport system substrate-binding protein
MRERVAIVFMTLSIVATLGLGGAVAYELAHGNQATTLESSGGTPVQTTGVAGATHVSTSGGTSMPTGGSSSSAPSGGGSSAPVTPSGGSSSSSSSSGGGTKPSTKVVASQHHGTITVGGIFDETGPIDSTVERDTVRSYFDLVNSQGGVNGYKLQLIDCDSKYDPSVAHQCAQKLASENVLAIVGWLSVSGEENETPYLTKQGIPVIGGLGVPSEYESPLSFPTTPSLVTDGKALGTRAGQVGLKKPGVIFLTANFVQPVAQSFLNAMKAQGINPVDVEYVDATKADYTDIVLKFQSDGAQSVAAFLDPFSYARLFQAMERQNWKVPVLGGGLDKASANQEYDSGCGSSCSVFGADSATPMLEYLDHTGTPAIAQYMGTVRKYYPSQYGALDTYTTQQWVAAEVFVQAIKDLGNKPVTRQNLVTALDGIKNFNDGGITQPITYGSGNHDPLHCLQWIHNNNGRWKTTSGWNCFG